MASAGFVAIDAASGTPDEVPGPIAEPARAPCRRWRWAAPLAAVGALGAVAAVAWRRRCLPSAFAGDALVSLAELPDDGLELDARRGDQDALREWLSAASASRDAADAGADPEAIEKAMSTKDPKEAERLVQRAMSRALSKAREQRHKLKHVVDSKRHSLKGSKPPFNLKSQQQVYTAQCVFNSLQAVDDIAMAAANLNDKVKTMTDLPNKTKVLAHMSKQAAETKAITGEVNDFYFMDNLAQLATHISLAANDCATTLTKNVDALCSASVFSLFGSLAQAAGGGSMIGLACRGVGQEVEAGAKPSNLGTGLVGHALPGVVPYGLDRRLQGEEEAAGAQQEPRQPAEAPPRKLMFGGGFGSDATLCGVHVMEVMWNLAQAALWITQAADGNLGNLGRCSNHNGIGDVSDTVCAVDVTGILFAYAEIARYLELVIVNCADTLNLGAMCGAGVTGVVGSLAQMGQAGAGLHYACEEMQDARVKAVLDVASGVEGAAQHAHKNFGRRLGGGVGGEERYPSVESLKGRFSSSEEVWNSMGYDLADTAAPFRQRQQHREAAPPASVAELVREDAEPEVAAAGGSLFGGMATCPSA